MAGLGNDYKISTEKLRADFAAAAAAGHDVMVHYVESDIDFGSSLEFMMDCYADIEKTRALSLKDKTERAYQDVVGHMAVHGTKNIIALYDLSVPFENAVKGAGIDVHPAVQQLHAEAIIVAEKARLAARPLWKRILGLN